MLWQARGDALAFSMQDSCVYVSEVTFCGNQVAHMTCASLSLRFV